jgi:hypothetical protein
LALTGTQADNYVTKLAAMKDSVGLTDTAFKEQTEGVNAAGFAFEQAKQQIMVLGQEIGDNLLPVITPLIDKVTEIVGKVSDWIKENPELTENIVLWGAAIGALMLVLGPLLIALPGIVTAISALLSPIGLVVIAAGALYLAFKNWDKIVKFVKGFVKDIEGYLEDLKKVAIKKVTDMIDWIIEKFEDLANLPKKMLQWGKNAISGFTDGIKDKMGSVTDAVKGVGDKIKGFLGFESPPKEGPLSTSDRWMPNMMGMFGEGITDNIPIIATAGDRLATSFKDKMMMLHTDVKTEVEDMMDDVEGAVVDATPDIEGKTQTLADDILNVFGNMLTDFNTNFVKPFIGKFVDELTPAVENFFFGIEDYESDWSTFWEDIWSSLKTYISKMITKLLIAVPLMLLFNALTGGVAATLWEVWNFLGFKKGGGVGYEEGGAIKGFAAGGSSTDTVPAMLTPGEYVIAKPMTDFIKRFKAIPQNLVGAIAGGFPTPTPAFADGGSVGAMPAGQNTYDQRSNYSTSINIGAGAIVINTPKFGESDAQTMFRLIERQAKNRGLKFATN